MSSEKEKLEKVFFDLKGEFEAFRGHTKEECARFNGLVEAVEAHAMDAEVMRQTLEIDLTTRYE